MFWERKVVRRLVRSIVCDIGSRSGDGDGGRGGSRMLRGLIVLASGGKCRQIY